jgi:hypothetical protein
MKSEIAVQSTKWVKCILFFVVAGVSLCVATPHAFAAPSAGTCSTESQIRQLHYWLGTWTVTAPGSANVSVSKVSLSLDGCAVVENWDDGTGHQGKNIFAYSSDDHSWRGMFVDNEGRAHVFVDGKVVSGSAEFYGPSRGSNGEKVLNRVRIVRVASDRIEQTWAKSIDNGATWTTVFRGEYSRKSL